MMIKKDFNVCFMLNDGDIMADSFFNLCIPLKYVNST